MPILRMLQTEEANARLVAATLTTDREEQTALLQKSLGSSNTQCETFAAFPSLRTQRSEAVASFWLCILRTKTQDNSCKELSPTVPTEGG
jgi:hypothetical protein